MLSIPVIEKAYYGGERDWKREKGPGGGGGGGGRERDREREGWLVISV